jgi:hypothetical protein
MMKKEVMAMMSPSKHNWFRDTVVFLCGYEILAITTGRVPTLTALQRRYRLLGPALFTGLAFHFYQEDVASLRASRRTAVPFPVYVAE